MFKTPLRFIIRETKKKRKLTKILVAPLQSALKESGAKLRNGGNVAVGAAKALPYHSAQPFVVRKGEPGTGCR